MTGGVSPAGGSNLSITKDWGKKLQSQLQKLQNLSLRADITKDDFIKALDIKENDDAYAEAMEFFDILNTDEDDTVLSAQELSALYDEESQSYTLEKFESELSDLQSKAAGMSSVTIEELIGATVIQDEDQAREILKDEFGDIVDDFEFIEKPNGSFFKWKNPETGLVEYFKALIKDSGEYCVGHTVNENGQARRDVVSKGKDYQFSSIYDSRKTSSTVFSSVNSALDSFKTSYPSAQCTGKTSLDDGGSRYSYVMADGNAKTVTVIKNGDGYSIEVKTATYPDSSSAYSAFQANNPDATLVSTQTSANGHIEFRYRMPDGSSKTVVITENDDNSFSYSSKNTSFGSKQDVMDTFAANNPGAKCSGKKVISESLSELTYTMADGTIKIVTVSKNGDNFSYSIRQVSWETQQQAKDAFEENHQNLICQTGNSKYYPAGYKDKNGREININITGDSENGYGYSYDTCQSAIHAFEDNHPDLEFSSMEILEDGKYEYRYKDPQDGEEKIVVVHKNSNNDYSYTTNAD